jgi:hypothetical protein
MEAKINVGRLIIRGTGRVIRKDGTVEEFTFGNGEEENGSDPGNRDAERDRGRSGHGDRHDGND